MDLEAHVKRYYQGHTLPIAVMRVIIEVERLHNEGKCASQIKQEFDDNWIFTYKQLEANLTLDNIQRMIDTIPDAKKSSPLISTKTNTQAPQSSG